MKKRIFIILILSNCFVFAQNSVLEKFSLEPFLGININKQAENELSNNFHVNAHGGLKFNYKVTNQFSAHLGIGLSDRRQTYKNLDTSFVLDEYRFFLELAGLDSDEIQETLEQNGLKLDRYTSTNGLAKVLQLEIPISVSYTWKSFQLDAGGYVGFLINSGKIEKVDSRIPLLESVEIDSLDQSGLISSFLPSSNTSSIDELNNSDDLDSFIYGLRFGLAYQFKSNVKFYVNYNLDLNQYKIDINNLVTNNKSFFRVGVAYKINSVKVNEDVRAKAKFE